MKAELIKNNAGIKIWYFGAPEKGGIKATKQAMSQSLTTLLIKAIQKNDQAAIERIEAELALVHRIKILG